MSFSNDTLNRAKCAGCNTNTLTVDTNGLKIHFLCAASSDIGVATRIDGLWAFAGNSANAGHMGRILAKILLFGKRANT